MAGSPFVIALIADFHDGNPEPVVASLSKRRPGVIAVAGDSVSYAVPRNGLAVDEQENVLPLLRACVSIAPTFVSLGNHEMVFVDGDLERIREVGATVVDDEWVDFDGVKIGGLTSMYVRFARSLRNGREDADGSVVPKNGDVANFSKPDLSWIPNAGDGYKILLSHHPELFPEIPDEVDLVLSGHAHGGQFAFYNPFRRRMCGLYAPNQGLFPKYTAGVYEKPSSSSLMVVSRGITNTTRIPRIGTPREVVYVEPKK